VQLRHAAMVDLLPRSHLKHLDSDPVRVLGRPVYARFGAAWLAFASRTRQPGSAPWAPPGDVAPQDARRDSGDLALRKRQEGDIHVGP
jgi:hypothetical protein